MTFFNFIIFVIISVFAFGCSTQEEVTEKDFSEDTNKAFSMIEQHGSFRSQSKEKTKTNQAKNRPPTLKLKPNQKKKISDEKMIETNQKLAFYCMKNRHLKKYKNNESLCHHDVTSILKSCQIKYHESQVEVINCLNRKLNIRS